jgi:hypothetical protein
MILIDTGMDSPRDIQRSSPVQIVTRAGDHVGKESMRVEYC